MFKVTIKTFNTKKVFSCIPVMAVIFNIAESKLLTNNDIVELDQELLHWEKGDAFGIDCINNSNNSIFIECY